MLAAKYEDRGRIDAAFRATPQHIFLLGGLAESLTNFRGPLIQAMIGAGHRITAAAGDENPVVAEKLKSWGVTFTCVPLARAGMNPTTDFTTIRHLTALMRRLSPDVFLGYTIKPVTYGLIAARMARVPKRFAMITGLGYAFTEGDGLKRRIARVGAMAAYRFALRFADKAIFQNPDDEAFFLEKGLLNDRSLAARVNGSGVDLKRFAQVPSPGGAIKFLMIARLLRDKGVYEYVEAARIVKRQHPQARFVLVGPLDPNPTAISAAEVDAWVRDGVIEYKGAATDVRPHIADCHVYVLPSYREGTPRTVLEAMAMGRAVITTDVPGCRQAIEDGETGTLVRPRDPVSLAKACNDLASNPQLMRLMGQRGRTLAQERFDDRAVAEATLAIMNAAT